MMFVAVFAAVYVLGFVVTQVGGIDFFVSTTQRALLLTALGAAAIAGALTL